MRGDQLARQWRILWTIESANHGVTVAQLAAEEDCSPRTIWRDFPSIQAAGSSCLLSRQYLKENNGTPHRSSRNKKTEASL